MRELHNFSVDGKVILFDKKSARAKWGHNQPEYLDSDNFNFLREGKTERGIRVFQLTSASVPIGDFHGVPYGGGQIVVEAEDCGGYVETCVHEDTVVWDSSSINPKGKDGRT